MTLALVSSANVYAANLPPVIEISSESQAFIPAQAPAAPKQDNAGVAQLLVLVEQLKSEVQSLRGQVEAQNFRIKKMEAAQLDRYRDLDRRMSSVMQQVAEQAKQTPRPPVDAAVIAGQVPVVVPPATPAPAPAVEQTPAPVEAAEPEEPVVATPPAPPAPQAPVAVEPPKVTDAQAYREAFALLRARQNRQAIEAFEVFIKEYPSSPLVANAYFWMGEAYRLQQNPEAAREQFMVVVGQYPDNPKTPTAAFRLGVIYAELGDAERSKEYLDYVLTNHPDSNVVPMVKDFQNK